MVVVFVVIVGPIGSGKTSLAERLAGRLRRGGRTVAVLDPDDVVAAVGGFRGITPERWQHARQVHAATVGAWLARGVDVIAPGPFFDDEENDTLLSCVPSGIEPRRVVLEVGFDESVRRVTGDRDNRDVSADTEFLRRAYDRFQLLRPTMPTADWLFDTSLISVEDMATTIASAINR